MHNCNIVIGTFSNRRYRCNILFHRPAPAQGSSGGGGCSLGAEHRAAAVCWWCQQVGGHQISGQCHCLLVYKHLSIIKHLKSDSDTMKKSLLSVSVVLVAFFMATDVKATLTYIFLILSVIFCVVVTTILTIVYKILTSEKVRTKVLS